MSDRIVVSAVGAAIEIDCSRLDGRAVESVEEAWQDALLASSMPADAVVRPNGGLEESLMLAALSTDVTLAALKHRRGELWMVHAAGLADARGRVVVLSAPSGTGKTTAARHLAKRYAYVSDETVGIDRQGGVVPYRKPLSIITAKGQAKSQITPSTVEGGTDLAVGLRLSKIVILDRSDDHSGAPQIEILDIVDALALLAPQSSYLCDDTAALRGMSALLKATGGAVRLRYREVETIDPLFDELMHAHPLTTPIRLEPYPVGSRTDVSDTNSEGARYYRGAVVDALRVADGRVVLLHRDVAGGRVNVLSGIGPALWGAANGATIQVLCETVVSKHGAPEGADARALVKDAVETLVADGLLSDQPGWRLHDGVAWTSADDRSTTVRSELGQEPVAIDDSAHVVWSVMSDAGSILQSDLIERCAQQFDLAPTDIEEDIVTLLQGLSRREIVIQP